MDLSKFYGMKESDIQKALVGKSFSEAGFISTSYNNFAKAPNGGKPFTDKTVKINYKAPAKTQALMPKIGAGGAWVKPLSTYFYENEFLLQKGSGLKITKVEKVGGHWEIQADLVGNDA